jgi:hypothetical protein
MKWDLTFSRTFGSPKKTTFPLLNCKFSPFIHGTADESSLKAGDEGEGSKPAWTWRPVGPAADEVYYLEKKDQVRFRVEGEIWHDPTPQKPLLNDKGQLYVPMDTEKLVPYTIIVSSPHEWNFADKPGINAGNISWTAVLVERSG